MIQYASSADARAAVVDAASREVGQSASEVYWKATTIHGPPWSLDWSGPFALWCLLRAGLVDWHWRTGSGFLYRLPMYHRNALQLASPGDVTFLPAPLDRHAIIGAIEEDSVLLICGCGKGGRVTAIRSAPSRLRNVASIKKLVSRYEG